MESKFYQILQKISVSLLVVLWAALVFKLIISMYENLY